MNTFTPGPWRLKTTGNFGNAIEAFRGVVGEYDNGWRVVAMYQHCEPTGLWAAEQENAAANAHLIAAAPDLLDALECCASFINAASDDLSKRSIARDFALDRIHAAIAKATGT